MRDPHVVALRYRVVAADWIKFDQPPPVETETEAFRVRLADGIVTFEMLEHHASEESAKKCVEPYLRAWEIDAALHLGRPEMSFEFREVEILDRNPPRGGRARVTSIHLTHKVAAAVGPLTRPQYPEPPQDFIASPDVETMWHRYQGYLQGREPLATMAYFCLTVLEASAGQRDEAANKYGISSKVLDTLGRLTTEIGDEETARKFNRLRELRPHTGAEKAWIEAAVKALIRRAGESAADPEALRRQLTMGDLPKLGPP